MEVNKINQNDETILLENSTNKNIYRNLIWASLQTGFSFALEYLPISIILYNLSQLGDTNQVAAFGLGQMYCQCCGFGILNGLACVILVTSLGIGNFSILGIWSIKPKIIATFLACSLMVPITILMFTSEYVLYFINGNAKLAEGASIVTKYVVPSILLNGIFVNTKVYLNGQNIYNLQLYTHLITCVCSFGLGYYFIRVLNWGLIGCCVFRAVYEIINIALLFTQIVIFQRKVIYRFYFAYLLNSMKFLKAAIPIGAILWLEWVCYDMFMMQASFLNEDNITAHVLMSNVAGFMYQFSYGVSIAATTFVGNEMGALNPKAANKYCTASLILVSIFLIVTQTTLFLLRTVFSEFLTTNREVSYLVEHAVYLMNIMIILDGFQGVLSGLVRAIGREKFACYSFIFMYLVIGQSCTYLLVQVAELGLHGVWLGMILGSGGYDLLNIWNLYAKDWNQLSQQVHHKISKH